jgi:hypothetical protein
MWQQPPNPFAAAEFARLVVSLAVSVAVWGWVYHHTRLPAAAVSLVWSVLSQTLLSAISRSLVDQFAPQGPQAVQTAIFLYGTAWNFAATGIFAWTMVSLLFWARPELRRRRARSAPTSTPEDLAARFGPPPAT